MLEILIIACAVCAGIPAVMMLFNLPAYRAPRAISPSPERQKPKISVLIPARNEAMSIEAALRSVLSNTEVDLEVLVLDDHSTDATASVVERVAAEDGRVRRLSAPDLPSGWCGKQFACFELSRHARHPWLVFMDADVRLSPDALARMVGYCDQHRVDLGSGVPRQWTGSFLERLLIPLIHFVLLGFLPVRQMRRSREVKYAAGCGQVFVARADAYRRCGGHSAIRRSLHDGLQLPRAFRRAGFTTDLFDPTSLASCRMYHTSRDTWAGLGKNATEGLGAPGLILPVTVLLMLGQVVPFLALGYIFLDDVAASPLFRSVLLASCLLALMPRVLCAWRFHQSWLSVLLHPIGVALLLMIQWQAWWRARCGRPMEWKGRAYSGQEIRTASSKRLPQSTAPLPGRAAS